MKPLCINLEFTGNTEESIKETILNSKLNSHLIFAKDYEEAEGLLKKKEGSDQEVIERIGTERGFLNVGDRVYRVVLSEYFIDPGSLDYVYRVEVEQL